MFLAGRAQFTAGKKLSVVYFPRSTLHLTGSLFSRRTDYFVFNEPALGAKPLDGFSWIQEHMQDKHPWSVSIFCASQYP